jgi:hypothetical protein
MSKVYRRRNGDKPAPQPCDLRIRYGGPVIVLKALSERGREWLTAATECDGAGPVEVGLMHLDEVLRMADQARLTLDVPWDDD